MIEAHYGALLDTAHESLLERLDIVRLLVGALPSTIVAPRLP